MTSTSRFGTSKREGHDSSEFYARFPATSGDASALTLGVTPDTNTNKFYLHSSTDMSELETGSVGLVFTSPPYHVGKEYDTDAPFDDYLALLGEVVTECWRVLEPGATLVINVANLGRRPYLRLNDHTVSIAEACGFLHVGEIIWIKADGAGGNCAWGSWRSPTAPSLRDLHEYLLIFRKGEYRRRTKGRTLTPTLTAEQFMESTLSTWRINPESAKRVGHPAPFPLALAERVVNLYSFKEDIVVDPFVGSGTTCIAAHRLGRKWVGYDLDSNYLDLAARRMVDIGGYTP